MEISERAVSSLAIATVHLVAAVVLTTLLGRVRKLSIANWLVILWLTYDVIVHVTLEGPFLYYSLVGTIVESDGILANVWKEYALADRRWGVSDPVVVSLEIPTVTLCSFLCIILIHAIIRDKPHRHFLQVVLSVCELYGGWMTFCPEWIIGSPNLNTSNPLYLWCYLVFFNGVWVVVPFLLLLQSWFAITSSAASKMDSRKRK